MSKKEKSQCYDEISIIIHTCDKYKFCWEGWYYYFKQYWNFNLPWKIYFLNEVIKVDYENIIQIKSGYGEWSNRLKTGLNEIKSDYIFYIQEDMWLQKKIDFDLFMDLFEIVKKNDFNALRIVCNQDFKYYKLKATNILDPSLFKFKNKFKTSFYSQ